MPVPQEVDDLERLVSGLVQEIGKKKASLKTLQAKIEVAQQHLDRCRYFNQICGDSLQRLKEAKTVSLDDYKRMVKLHEDNHDLILKYQAEVLSKTRDKRTAESDIPLLEADLAQARKRLAQWGVVIFMGPR